MSGMSAAVLIAFHLVLPILLAALGVTAMRRDELVTWILFCAVLLFAMVVGGEILYTQSLPVAVLPPSESLGIWLAAAVGLGARLYRDRRRHHVRTTLESLLLLGSGAILLAALLSMPVWLADARPPGA